MPKPNRFVRKIENDDAMSRHKNNRFIYRVEGQQQSPFFRLPVELREQVYRFVLPRSYRKSTGIRRDEFGFEEEWGRTNYNARRRWQEFEQFPLCLWTRGDLVLLRICRRISNEAAPLFYKNNMFEMSVRGDEPELRIAYFPWPLPSSRCMFPNMTTYGGIRWSRGTKKLTTIKREHVREIRYWSIMFHTHYAAEGKDWRAAAEETSEAWEDELQIQEQRLIMPQGNQPSLSRAWLERYCASMSAQREAYRLSVIGGLSKWIDVLEEREEELRQVAVAFEAYSDYKGMGFTTDLKLVRAIREYLPEWVHDTVFLLGGKISEDELEAWEID